MPRKDVAPKTEQVNFRLRSTTLDRMDAYKVRHPLNPTLTSIVERAVNEWLDREAPKLPPPDKSDAANAKGGGGRKQP